MRKCIKCGVELELGVNWTEAGKRQCIYTCRPCDRKRVMQMPERNTKRMWVNGKHISTKHPLHKPGRYKSFSDAAFASLQKDTQVKEGYVYAITNPAWPDWVKIGMAVDADDRCNGYQTSSPFRDYTLEHMVVTKDRRTSEAQAHKLATKIAKEVRGEWFKLDIEKAKTILDKCSVIEETKSKKEKEQVKPATQDLFSYAETGT
tara:strand:+ start:292 stop:903 length:612 start_codon:yes stop_codon:yes gene_type:complete